MASHTIEQIVIALDHGSQKPDAFDDANIQTGLRRLSHHGVTGALAAGKERSNVFGHMPLPEESVL